MKKEDGDRSGDRDIKHEPLLATNGDDMLGMSDVVTIDEYMEPEEEPCESSAPASIEPQQLAAVVAAPPKVPLV